ncbi:MAG TPA: nuclear transport factor 2 family protein [Ktedonobacteraceae bacterium]|jgi:ketosteroid isomerase-like protein|nr:nuclear transport factor 2 family protein [Ktedonobacteraceae bacterium]
MSEQIIRNLFRVVDARDWNSMQAFFCEDVIYERPGYDAIVGFENLLHFYEHVRMIASGNHELEHIVIDEERGSCWGRFVGVNKEGMPLDERFADVYLFENGRIKQRCSYFFRPAV